VEQQAPVVVVEGPEVSFPPEPIYAFSGGQFRIQMTNQGNTVLNQVYLNTRFDLNYLYNICLRAPAKQRLYENLNLAPGASVWLDFGDIEAEGQILVPAQFCFWTSAPNNRPDTHHEDDAFCTAYTVPVRQPGRLSFRLYPNPAAGEIFLDWPEQHDRPDAYAWYDGLGKRLAGGTLDPNEPPWRIATPEHSSGLYFLRAGGRLFKVLVGQ
jgi:hypothetical protein